MLSTSLTPGLFSATREKMAIIVQDHDLQSHIRTNGRSLLREEMKQKKKEKRLSLPPIKLVESPPTNLTKARTAPVKPVAKQDIIIVKKGRIMDDLEVRG